MLSWMETQPETPCMAVFMMLWDRSDAGDAPKKGTLNWCRPSCVWNVDMWQEFSASGIWWYQCLRSISENRLAPFNLCLMSWMVSMCLWVWCMALLGFLMSMFMRICPGCVFSVMTTLEIQGQFSFRSMSSILSEFLSSCRSSLRRSC